MTTMEPETKTSVEDAMPPEFICYSHPDWEEDNFVKTFVNSQPENYTIAMIAKAYIMRDLNLCGNQDYYEYVQKLIEHSYASEQRQKEMLEYVNSQETPNIFDFYMICSISELSAMGW